jgi:hypothetical protein
MKNLHTPRDSMRVGPSLSDLTTHPSEYRNEERLLLVAFVIGNLIFWGSLFHALSF